MGRISRHYQDRIDHVSGQVAEAYEEERSDLDAQRILLPFIEELLHDSQSGGMTPGTLLKAVLPAMWKEVGGALDTSPASARTRLFSYDLETRGELLLADAIQGLRRDDNSSYERVLVGKLTKKTPINLAVWSELRDLFEGWLMVGGDSENDRIARLVLAISFFTGRRPWSETAFLAEFESTEEPVLREWKISSSSDPKFEVDFDLISTPWEPSDWADGWITFRGNAKRTKKEDLAGWSIPLDIPVVGSSPEDLIRALGELRGLERGKSWFRPEVDAGDSIIGSALQQNTAKAMVEVEAILEPIYAAGHRFPDTENGRFTAYHLRPLYANRMAWEMRSVTGANTDSTVIAKWLLGHFGGLGKASLAYQSFEFLGDAPIPPVRG